MKKHLKILSGMICLMLLFSVVSISVSATPNTWYKCADYNYYSGTFSPRTVTETIDGGWGWAGKNITIEAKGLELFPVGRNLVKFTITVKDKNGVTYTHIRYSGDKLWLAPGKNTVKFTTNIPYNINQLGGATKVTAIDMFVKWRWK